MIYRNKYYPSIHCILARGVSALTFEVETSMFVLNGAGTEALPAIDILTNMSALSGHKGILSQSEIEAILNRVAMELEPRTEERVRRALFFVDSIKVQFMANDNY
jgi:hypothetical protein